MSRYLWDYDRAELEKTESGRIKILERMINYGPEKGEKIPLNNVKKYWDNLELFPKQKKLLELLIWGKTQTKIQDTSPQNKMPFSTV